jgi:hypothetical protein
MKEAKCHKFWEQNLNPITMRPNDNSESEGNHTEAHIQEKDEKLFRSKARARTNARIKKVSKFW